GIPIRMDGEEAELRADELLMEFIALLTTGHRLEQVLSEQVEALRQPGRELQRTLARLVTAAHTAGGTIPADSFGSLSTPLQSADSIGDALSVLRGEHILTIGDDGWRGLHELRSEV